jgi:hypothetical protein
MLQQPTSSLLQINDPRKSAIETGATLANRNQSVEEMQSRIEMLEKELSAVRMKGKLISQELDLFRQRRVIFWSDRFRNTFDAWNLMNIGFQQLKDDSAIFCGANKGYRLQPSLSLLRVPFLTYRIRLAKPRLQSLLLAPVVDVPLTTGEVCLRIFSGTDCIATSTAVVTDISDNAPIRLNFPPIETSDKHELILRVFVQGVDAPVRIFELRRYALGGFGRLSTRPFAGYIFAP